MVGTKANTDQVSGSIIGQRIFSKEEYQSECEEKRAEVDYADDNILTPGAKKENYAIVSGGISGETSLLPAFCRKSYYKRTPKRAEQLLTGLEPGERDDIPLCGSDTHSSNDQSGGHSEARIIGELGSKLAGKTLVMNINLLRPTGELSKLPCPQCHALICAAIESCGATIIVCDHDNNGVDMSEACHNGVPKENRKELEELLDYKLDF